METRTAGNTRVEQTTMRWWAAWISRSRKPCQSRGVPAAEAAVRACPPKANENGQRHAARSLIGGRSSFALGAPAARCPLRSSRRKEIPRSAKGDGMEGAN